MSWDGVRRRGKPRSNAERAKRHKRIYGKGKLPPRGTGLLKANLRAKLLGLAK